jgi:hypothetical protein
MKSYVNLKVSLNPLGPDFEKFGNVKENRKESNRDDEKAKSALRK